MSEIPEEAARCPDCQVLPGEPHLEGCDVAPCPVCGMQRLQCEEHAYAEVFSIWTGQWPGKAECERLDWWAYFVPYRGWIRCEKDHPEARHDLNRLVRAGATGELVWSRDKQEWINA